jgi:hypothetical protein
MRKERLIIGTVADERGEYSLTPIPSGRYDLIIRYVGFEQYELKDIEIKSDEIKIIYDVIMDGMLMYIAGGIRSMTIKEMRKERREYKKEIRKNRKKQ